MALNRRTPSRDFYLSFINLASCLDVRSKSVSVQKHAQRETNAVNNTKGKIEKSIAFISVIYNQLPSIDFAVIYT